MLFLSSCANPAQATRQHEVPSPSGHPAAAQVCPVMSDQATVSYAQSRDALLMGAPVAEQERSSNDWRARRVRAVREISRDCAPLFLQCANAVLKVYKRYSEAGDGVKCQQVLHSLLDLPDRSLRSGRSSQQKQWLSAAADVFDQQLKQVGSAPVAAAVTPKRDAGAPVASNQDGESKPASSGAATPNAPIPREFHGDASALPDEGNAPRHFSPQADEHHGASEHMGDADAPLDDRTRAVRRAMQIIRTGGPNALPRAAKALMQSAMAPMDAVTRQQLRALHPKAKRRLPALPAHCAAGVMSLDQLGKVMKRRIHNGSAPVLVAGPARHTWLSWESGTNEAKSGFRLLIRDICERRVHR